MISVNQPLLQTSRAPQALKSAIAPLAQLEMDDAGILDRVTMRTIQGHDDVPMMAKKEAVSEPRADFTKNFITRIRQSKGEAKLTFVSTPAQNKKQGFNIAEGFRLEDKDYGIVLDPREMSMKGWSAKDYSAHWSDVRRAFAKDLQMVMGPGWKQSPHCVDAAKQAHELGIPTKSYELKSLDRAAIEIRLTEVDHDLTQRGFPPQNLVGTLNGAVDHNYLDDQAGQASTTEGTLTDPAGYLSDVVGRTLRGREKSTNDGALQAGMLTQSTFTQLYLEKTREQLNGRPLTYVSTPITGGTAKFDLFDELRVKDKTDFDAAGKQRFLDDVIVKNTNSAFHVAEALREDSSYGVVMDPSEITIPRWSQAEYSAHWDEVVLQLASKLVLAPGWDHSTGSILELKRALDKGIPIEEVTVETLSSSDLSKL